MKFFCHSAFFCKYVIFVILFLCLIQEVIGQDSSKTLQRRNFYPIIKKLASTDPLFMQYSSDVEDNYKVAAKSSNTSENQPFLTFYRYIATTNDTIISIAARCNIPYETIATLNRIASAKTSLAGKTLLLPTVSGMFIREKNLKTDLEKLAAAVLTTIEEKSYTITVLGTIDDNPVLFFPGRRCTATERAFFLNTAFRFPLPDGILTSDFGMRKNPVTGKQRFHHGIDLAAPEGTPVYAAREGIITATGSDSIYGNYVVITHSDGWQSFYAHLQSIQKNCLNRHVDTGYSIGRVGNTGQSTGPHLHFELQESGSVRDPKEFLLK